MTLIFDLLTPKSIFSCPCSVDHLFSKFRVHRFGNRRSGESIKCHRNTDEITKYLSVANTSRSPSYITAFPAEYVHVQTHF